MLLHVLLYLALVFAGTALIALLLTREACLNYGAGRRPLLERSSRVSAAVFLLAAVGILASGGRSGGALVAGQGLPSAWRSSAVPPAQGRPPSVTQGPGVLGGREASGAIPGPAEGPGGTRVAEAWASLGGSAQ